MGRTRFTPLPKNEFYVALSRVLDVSKKEVEIKVDAVFDFIRTLSEERPVKVPNFGTFKIKEVPERIRRNPRTGEQVVVAAHRKLVFKEEKKK